MKEFIRKWSNWWIFNPKRKQLDDAFEKELNELIEREVALRIHDVIKSLPEPDEIRMKARELDEKDFAQWMYELQKGNVL